MQSRRDDSSAAGTGCSSLWIEATRRHNLREAAARLCRVSGPLAVVMMVLGAPGCQRADVKRCLSLCEADDKEAAAAACEQAWRTAADRRSAVCAARAHLALGHHDRVLMWRDRLRGTQEEADLWALSGASYRRRHEPEAAAHAYERASTLHAEHGRVEAQAKAEYALFYLCWERDQYRVALEHAKQALDLAIRARDTRQIGMISEGVFALLYQVGDLSGARQALAVANQLARPETPRARARFLNNEALIYLGEERVALARQVLDQALLLALEAGVPDLLRSIYLNMVDASLRLGDIKTAQRHLEAAWRHADPNGLNRAALMCYQARVQRARGEAGRASETIRRALKLDPEDDWAWQLEHERGLLAKAEGDTRAAEDAHEQACRILERMRAALGFETLKSWHFARKREPFEALFLLQIARRDGLEQAVRTVERVRARAFVDALVRASLGRRQPVERVGAVIADAAGRIQTLQRLLPVVQERCAGRLRPVSQLLSRVGYRHVLVYFAAADRLWLLRVSGGRIDAGPLQPGITEIKALVQRFLAAPDDEALAAALGNDLLPRWTLPPPGKPLFIVTDDMVARVPFAALRRDGRYLIQDHVVLYLPSLNALDAIERSETKWQGPAVVIGDPQGDLPAAAGEARAVAAARGVRAAVGTAAQSSRIPRLKDGARLLHLATHSGVGPSGPWLRLADRDVTAEEIMRSRLSARLVVLAGCATGARSARGIARPLPAAFLAAGSRAVVATLWSLRDEEAKDFLVRFYQENASRDTAQALARAQRHFVSEGEPPSRWAAFFVLGSDGREEDAATGAK